MPPTRRNYRQRKEERPRGKPIRPHFFKIILQPTIRSKKLLISGEFVTEFGDELSSIAFLTVPNGRVWRVGIQKAGENFWFRDGWQKFMEKYSIDLGYCLVFRYEGNSQFHVMIFYNMSGYQIEYPSDHHEHPSNDLDADDDDNDDDEDDVSVEIVDVKPRIPNAGSFPKRNFGRPCFGSSSSKGVCKCCNETSNANMSRKGKQKVNEMPCRRNFSVKHEAEEQFVPKSSSCIAKRSKNKELDDKKKKAMREASKHNPKNPSFMMTFKRYNRNYVYVPAEFSMKYLKNSSEFFTLEAPNGKKYLVDCCHNSSRTHAVRFVKGWPEFTRDNNLEEGDVCVFELINRKIVVLKVWIYRSSG